jgi:hypothetical protein
VNGSLRAVAIKKTSDVSSLGKHPGAACRWCRRRHDEHRSAWWADGDDQRLVEWVALGIELRLPSSWRNSAALAGGMRQALAAADLVAKAAGELCSAELLLALISWHRGARLTFSASHRSR